MIKVVEIVTVTPELGENLGRIMPFLDKNHTGGPVDSDYLENSVSSPSSVLLVASINEHEPPDIWELARQYPIVGAATLSTLHGVLGEKAWLEDFVVAPDARNLGVAQGLWSAMIEWRKEKGLYQMRFNSTANRERAHGFYQRNNCQELSTGKTTLFVHNIER